MRGGRFGVDLERSTQLRDGLVHLSFAAQHQAKIEVRVGHSGSQLHGLAKAPLSIGGPAVAHRQSPLFERILDSLRLTRRRCGAKSAPSRDQTSEQQPSAHCPAAATGSGVRRVS